MIVVVELFDVVNYSHLISNHLRLIFAGTISKPIVKMMWL